MTLPIPSAALRFALLCSTALAAPLAAHAQEAAVALAAGRAAGLQISEAEAIAWITANPAKSLGILDQTGTLEPGKRADIVLWDRNPFSVYARTEKVFIDGALAWDRRDPRYQPRSDFDLGQPGEGVR